MTDDEPPVEHIRNALAVLINASEPYIGPTGTRFSFAEEDITAVKTRLWRAVEQLEPGSKQPPRT